MCYLPRDYKTLPTLLQERIIDASCCGFGLKSDDKWVVEEAERDIQQYYDWISTEPVLKEIIIDLIKITENDLEELKNFKLIQSKTD